MLIAEARATYNYASYTWCMDKEAAWAARSEVAHEPAHSASPQCSLQPPGSSNDLAAAYSPTGLGTAVVGSSRSQHRQHWLIELLASRSALPMYACLQTHDHYMQESVL